MKNKVIENSKTEKEKSPANIVIVSKLTAKEDFLNEISNQDDLQLCPLIYYFIFWGEHEETDL
jgi:hypothetical protein